MKHRLPLLWLVLSMLGLPTHAARRLTPAIPSDPARAEVAALAGQPPDAIGGTMPDTGDTHSADVDRHARGEWNVSMSFGETRRIPRHTKVPVMDVRNVTVRYARHAHRRAQTAYELTLGGLDAHENNYCSMIVVRRFTFLRDKRFSAACDLGIGGIYFSQSIPGQKTQLNFTEAAGVAMTYRLNADTALTGQVRFVHASNANTALPNTGINGTGYSFGYSWYVPSR